MVSRRTFIKGSLAVGLGLSLGLFGWNRGVEETCIPPSLGAPWRWAVTLNTRRMALSREGYEPHLALATELGASMVRFDLSWNVVEPELDHWRAEQLAWYGALVRAAKRHGLEVIGNLTDYPGWAIAELARNPAAFQRRWYRYVAAVARELDADVAYYQMGNEFNSVLDPIPREHDAEVFRVAHMALGDELGSHRSRVRTVINPFYGFNHLGSEWDPALRMVLEAASEAIDVLALDYYPGSYNLLGDPQDWSPLSSLAGYAREYDKALAIGETGCPSFGSPSRQSCWYEAALPALAREVEGLGLSRRMAFVCLFELADRPALDWWELWRPTEVTLGLADRYLRPKPCFRIVQGLIGKRPRERDGR